MKFKIKKPKIKLGKPSLKGIQKTVSKTVKDTVRVSQDVYTGGNRKLVDQYTGGAMTSFMGAAGGNSKDLFRTGATGAAAFFGGPAAAMAMNSKMASGGNPASALMGVAQEGSGMDLSFLNQANDLLKNPMVNQLTSSILKNKAPRPAPPVSTPVISVANPIEQKGMSAGMMAMIGGGVLAVIAILYFVLKKK